MANQWFRMYHEFATDPKVQMLSETDQRRYVMLLCLRCSNDGVTLHETEVAFQLRISNEELAITKANLMAKGLVDEGLQPIAWDKRQYASDSSAARVARHREKKKQACNVTVTPPDTDTDTDTDTESERESVSSDKSLSTPPAKKSPTGTRLPESWRLTPEYLDAAIEIRPELSPETVAEIACGFRDYWISKPGAAGRKTNWLATWRNWIRREKQFGGASRETFDHDDDSWVHGLSPQVVRQLEGHQAGMARGVPEPSRGERGKAGVADGDRGGRNFRLVNDRGGPV